MQKKAEEGLCSIARVFPADRGPRSSVWTDEDEEEDRGDGVGKGRKNGRVYSAGGSFAINCCDEQAAGLVRKSVASAAGRPSSKNLENCHEIGRGAAERLMMMMMSKIVLRLLAL